MVQKNGGTNKNLVKYGNILTGEDTYKRSLNHQDMVTEKRYCKVCGEEIHGRRDKQYCSDYCRSTQYQSVNADITGFMRRVNYTIRKNRSILSHVNTKGKSKVHRNKLIELGMNFNYFTNVYRTKAGKTYYFCYDQGYLELEDDYYALVVKEEYVT